LAKTYVRIYGPPLMKALKALEGVAIEMSKEKEIKFSHKCIPYPTRMQADNRDWSTYLNNLKNTYVDCYEPAKIISDAKQLLGDHDFMFEWVEKKPTMKQLEDLIEKIDKALAGMGVRYTLTTE
jgi:hypothetical protein